MMYNYANMEIIKTKIRKWGNSMGIVIPSEVLKQMPLSEGEEIVITIQINNDFSDIFAFENRNLSFSHILTLYQTIPVINSLVSFPPPLSRLLRF